jgi:sugar-specific transcriptional regulator TrmB
MNRQVVDLIVCIEECLIGLFVLLRNLKRKNNVVTCIVTREVDSMTKNTLSEKLIKELESFDLTGNEAKVYLALLQYKKASAHAIAKLSGAPRQEVYRVLPRLEKLGMVEVIIDRPTKFLAIDPGEVLSELIERQQKILTERISDLRNRKSRLETELREVAGKSAGFILPEPVHFALISGQHLVNEKIKEMLENAKSEVLWMAPRVEIRRAVIYDRDEMLHQCAQRNVAIRIITEVDRKNEKEVSKLSRFCNVRHAPGVSSLITIVDNKELIIGSAVHTKEDSVNSGLINKLWTNDTSHINIMKDFFEKVWKDSIPADLKIKSTKKTVES